MGAFFCKSVRKGKICKKLRKEGIRENVEKIWADFLKIVKNATLKRKKALILKQQQFFLNYDRTQKIAL